VNTTVIHNTYIDRTVIVNHTVVNDRHVAYAGGPGGINHGPTAEERVAMNERHTAATSFQTQHMNAAMADRGSYAKANGGHPQTMAVQRPMGMQNQGNFRGGQQPNSYNNANRGGNQQYNGQNRQQYQNQNQNRQAPQGQPRGNESRPAPQQRQESHPQQHEQSHPEHESEHRER
jgi:hypothetical protein